MRLLPLLVLMACEPMPATGDPLAPVPASGPTASAPGPKPTTAPAPVGPDGFDFDEDASEEGLPTGDLDPAQLLAISQGKEPPPAGTMPTPAPAPVAEPTPVPVPVAAPAPVAPVMAVWDPSTALPPDWGVRLVSTLADTQPPRAVLGLSDGSEVVVQPGTFLPDHRLVVMAVGRNAIQVSRVVPDGYQAKVETRTLSSLYPTQPLAAPN